MKIKSCEFNMDNACVELRLEDGTLIAINTIAIENKFAEDMYQASELTYLVYNDPLAYVDLVLNGNPMEYLKNVTEYKSIDS